MTDVLSEMAAQRRDEYLAQAADADSRAMAGTNEHIRQSWKDIANSYRQLAAQVGQIIKSDSL